MAQARFDYSCSNCKGPVLKKPCGTKRTMTKKGKLEEEYTGLHGFRCSNCGPGIKVNRKVRKLEQTETPTV